MKFLSCIFFISAIIMANCVASSTVSAAEGTPQAARQVIAGPNISEKFLEQAREYREQGRYELARQSYAQALSTCRTNEELAIVRHEMGGVELLLRTMR